MGTCAHIGTSRCVVVDAKGVGFVEWSVPWWAAVVVWRVAVPFCGSSFGWYTNSVAPNRTWAKNCFNSRRVIGPCKALKVWALMNEYEF